jgi:hypothetical protein
MKTNLIAAVAAVSLALATPALAGDNHHWNHGGGWGWHNGAWVWGLGSAAVLGAVLANPYLYGPPYTYPVGPYVAPAYPTLHQCPTGNGGWYWC